MPVSEPRITYVVFQESEIRGKWEGRKGNAFTHGADPTEDALLLEDANVEPFKAAGDNCELWIVRPDGLRKAWSFKLGATISIRGNTAKFHQGDVANELSVDEDKQSGN